MTLLRGVPGMALSISAASLLSAHAAMADLRLCNMTDSRINVAIGYCPPTDRAGCKALPDWKTEGWWDIESNSCQTLVGGTLASRYFYVYAIDIKHGGEWSGDVFMCTHDKEFTIEGAQDCIARGFQKTGFFEIDTANQVSWTVQLTDEADREDGGAEAPEPVGAIPGEGGPDRTGAPGENGQGEDDGSAGDE